MRITELMDMMNYNLSRESGRSMLGEIEMKITDLHFENLRKISLEEQREKSSYFESNLFTNPSMFPKSIDYSSLSNVSDYYSTKKQEFNNSLNMDGVKSL